ncbi:MAG TPA: DUF3500 domain-containing protein [Gammaproteobacteria bacterium]|nr:DUF3500 domain-containing protein [Gammaproteobacteria bacterium]
MNRRMLLKGAGAAGALVGAAALGKYAVLAPPRSAELDSVDALAARIRDSLSDAARASACFPYDHPLRQYHNRGLWAGGLIVSALSVDWDTRCALTDLMHAGLSEAGRERVPEQDSTSFFGTNGLGLAICGDPRTGPYQILLSGVHLNLRVGRASADGAAFGGPQVYGDQSGNGRVGLPGNVYRYQMEAAHRLVAALTPAERAAVRVARAPAQVRIGVQGRDGRFDGVAVGDLSANKRKLAHEAVAGIVDTYAEAEYAWQCLERNGGVDALRFADYDEDHDGGRRAGDAPSQVFRFEGPAAVLHFRGEPHVHAFVNIAMDGERPLSVGEALGENPSVLEGEDLAAFFETAMRAQGEADVALYPAQGAVGRLRAGTVRTGDIWTAESWVDDFAVVEVKGADLAPELADRMRARGTPPQSGSTYRIATTTYIADSEASRLLGRVSGRRPLGPLRDALVAHARAHGFARS